MSSRPFGNDMQSTPNVLRKTRNHNAPPMDRYEHEQSHANDGDDQIFVQLNEDLDYAGPGQWTTDTQTSTQKSLSRRNSRSYASRVSRQKSRRRDMLGRQSKPGITVDTSFTRHKGNVPHQVFPQDGDRSAGLSRKQSWFGVRRASAKSKGLGIMKGTPQPDFRHRRNASTEKTEAMTAISTPGSKTWQEISPWDRPIPIGISVPTDSVSEYSTPNGVRHRAGSDSTLVTPSIIITPAANMQSAWSPDTAFTDSEYTPSIYSRADFNKYHTNVPPVPALPAGVQKSSNAQGSSVTYASTNGAPGHTRHDTLDSAGTAFEEDDEGKYKDRIMSTGTMFEDDDTPLRDRTAEKPLVLDTTNVPTPRRSQGWWNVITTPFVMTPNTATWPKSAHENDNEKPPEVPMVPTQYDMRHDDLLPPPLVTARKGVPEEISSDMLPKTMGNVAISQDVTKVEMNRSSPQANSVNVTQNQTVQNVTTNERSVTSPLSAMSASPVVGTAAIGTVLMPRQIEEQPRQININIELQDRRPIMTSHTNSHGAPPTFQQIYTSAPAHHTQNVSSSSSSAKTSSPQPKSTPQPVPVFAPPPTFAHKNQSHFSYDNISRSTSPGSTPDMKRPKKHRKVCDLMALMPFGKKKAQNTTAGKDEKKEKKKKRKFCIWGCCCCLIIIILLAILIPVIVVVTRRNSEKPTTTPAPGDDVGNQWLNLPDLPPMPTGISTIAQPEAIEEESGCVAPTTLWSCALPKELHNTISPNKPDQPNFKIQVTFENGTETTLPKRAPNPVSAGSLVRSLLRIRAAVAPSPPAPSDAEMNFLGKTTDNNVAPFEGEDTPLFITFQDPTTSSNNSPRLLKRQSNDPTNITAVIPPPMLSPDGSAAPANLLPLPVAQPLRLYNRGKDTEYYGFYTYYDRSIFLKSLNGTNRGGNPADTDGGSNKDAATLRCTYSETRFFVQIWTRSEKTKPLLQRSASDDSNAFKRPGTFPYPVSVTIDRHGGNPAKKNLYCYDIESDGTIKNQASSRRFQFEDRGFGGNLVNGTQGRGSVTGPIDGGTGGCRCMWQNWLA